MIVSVLAELERAEYRVTHVFWHQGENDWAEGTSPSQYRAKFFSFVDTLRSTGVGAKVFAAISTKCLLIAPHVAGNQIARIQADLASHEEGVEAGIDTDSLLGDFDRYDDCHFSGSGIDKVAAAWAQLLMSKR